MEVGKGMTGAEIQAIQDTITAACYKLQRAIELADKEGHPEAVFYLRAALAAADAAQQMIAYGDGTL